jgi:hypothetical protein
MKQLIECGACKGGTKPLSYPEGGHLICPYCKDTGKREINVPHPSHKMSTWRSEIRCPGNTARFYGVRECEFCGEEELQHPAGHFLEKLLEMCIGEKNEKS